MSEMLGLENDHMPQLVRMACAVLPDQPLLRAANAFYIAPRAGEDGRAYAYLAHYLSGRGTDVRFGLRDLLRDCPPVASKIAAGIAVQRRMGWKSGTVLVDQNDYQPESRLGMDWRLAIGGFTCVWKIDPASPARVALRVNNLYQFHGRYELTRCVHEAAMELARSGRARRFHMIGRAVMPWGEDPRGLRTESWRLR